LNNFEQEFINFRIQPQQPSIPIKNNSQLIEEFRSKERELLQINKDKRRFNKKSFNEMVNRISLVGENIDKYFILPQQIKSKSKFIIKATKKI
jgi:hypothetical protein